MPMLPVSKKDLNLDTHYVVFFGTMGTDLRNERNRPQRSIGRLTFHRLQRIINLFNYADCRTAPHQLTCPENRRKPDGLRESQAGGYTARSGLLELEAVEKTKSFFARRRACCPAELFLFWEKTKMERWGRTCGTKDNKN